MLKCENSFCATKRIIGQFLQVISKITKHQLHKWLHWEVMTPFRKFAFCATDFYLANGIRYWIFLLHGCWANQINIYFPKGGSVKPFFGIVLLCLQIFACFGCPLTRNKIRKWIFLWHKSEARRDLEGHQRSAA